jgi:peptide deformylase
MNKDDIITLPHDSLRSRSKRIAVVSEDTIKLIQNMESATLDWEESRKHEVGVALAAVQINDLRRVVIIRNDFDNKDDKSFTAFINPEITKYEGDIVEDYEGCLSVKDVYGKVPRYDKVRVKALNMRGQPVRFTAEGFLARILQHEIDHTNGILFIDHIKDKPEAFYMLTDSGDLEKLDDKAVSENSILW